MSCLSQVQCVIAPVGFTVYHVVHILVVDIAVDLHVAGMFLVVIVLLVDVLFCYFCFLVDVKVAMFILIVMVLVVDFF